MGYFCKKRLILSAACIAVFAMSVIPTANATMSVSPAIMTFMDGQNSRKDFSVTNLARRTQYLEITPYRINRPGNFPEELSISPNPEEVGLLVAPRRIILKPGETKLIRTILLDKISRQTAPGGWRSSRLSAR